MQFNQAPAPRESSIGDAYDPTADYSVGDFCIHDNVLCKCIVPISGGEAWNPEHWTETNIGDEIRALNSKIATLEDKITDYKILQTTKTGTANSSGSLDTGMSVTKRIIVGIRPSNTTNGHYDFDAYGGRWWITGCPANTEVTIVILYVVV